MERSFGVKLPGLVPTLTESFKTLPDYVAELEKIGFDDVMDGEHILFVPVMDHPGGAGNMVHERVTQPELLPAPAGGPVRTARTAAPRMSATSETICL